MKWRTRLRTALGLFYEANDRLLSRVAFYLAVCLLFAAGQGLCEPLPVIPEGEDRLQKQGALEGQP